MKIYRYSASGLYIGEIEADESQLEGGQYEMPPNSTFVPPPVCGDGECLVFKSGAWETHRIDGDSFLEVDNFIGNLQDDEERKIARENLSIIVEIIEIETLEQHRAMRDFALTGDRSRLEEIEAKISNLRRQLI